MLQDRFFDIIYALRAMVTRPGFTVVVVLTLAVGIGANVAMFSIVYSALIEPLPYEDPERLVLGRTTFGDSINWTSSSDDFYDWRDQNTTLESLAASWGFTHNLIVTGGEEPEQVPGIIASWYMFRTLGVRPQLGRDFTAEEELDGAPNVAIISYSYWQRRFGGSPDAVGQTLGLEGDPATVVGVLPAGFRYLIFDVDIWLPMRKSSPYAGARRFHNWILVGRLEPGVTLDEAQSQMDVISARLQKQYPDSNKDKALLLTKLQDVFVENYGTALLLLMAAVGFVLLIACANVAGLLLARGSERRGELAVRTALGAVRSRLVSQLLTESLMLALAGGVLGLVLALWLERVILEFMHVNVPGVTAGISTPAITFALVLSLLTGVLFGIVPALRSAQTDVVQDLKAGARTSEGGGGTKLRSALVIAQVASSVVLLIGSGLLIRSFASLQTVDPGFEIENLLTAEIRLPQSEYEESYKRVQFYTELLEETRAIPGVLDAAIINLLPIRDGYNNTYVYAADDPPIDPGDRRIAYQRIVFPGYFKMMGIPLLAGRDVSQRDQPESPPALLISKTMADTLFPGENPLGQFVVADFGESVTAEVIGVVGDVKVTGLAFGNAMTMYSPYWQRPAGGMRFAIRTHAEPEAVAGAFRNAVWKQDKDIPVSELQSMEDVVSSSVADQKNITISLTLFSAVALLLAALGLYGVLACFVSRRSHEIGIRIAMGASTNSILSMVITRGMALVGIGLAVGISGAYWAMRLIQQLLFGVESTDPLTWAAVAVFFGVVALIACLLPALRAIRVDPVVTLQAE